MAQGVLSICATLSPVIYPGLEHEFSHGQWRYQSRQYSFRESLFPVPRCSSKYMGEPIKTLKDAITSLSTS